MSGNRGGNRSGARNLVEGLALGALTVGLAYTAYSQATASQTVADTLLSVAHNELQDGTKKPDSTLRTLPSSMNEQAASFVSKYLVNSTIWVNLLPGTKENRAKVLELALVKYIKGNKNVRCVLARHVRPQEGSETATPLQMLGFLAFNSISETNELYEMVIQILSDSSIYNEDEMVGVCANLRSFQRFVDLAAISIMKEKKILHLYEIPILISTLVKKKKNGVVTKTDIGAKTVEQIEDELSKLHTSSGVKAAMLIYVPDRRAKVWLQDQGFQLAKTEDFPENPEAEKIGEILKISKFSLSFMIKEL